MFYILYSELTEFSIKTYRICTHKRGYFVWEDHAFLGHVLIAWKIYSVPGDFFLFFFLVVYEIRLPKREGFLLFLSERGWGMKRCRACQREGVGFTTLEVPRGKYNGLSIHPPYPRYAADTSSNTPWPEQLIRLRTWLFL